MSPTLDPWFAGREGTVLFYKVNRRPVAQTSMFRELPPDAFEHLVDSLLFGEPVETQGKGERRTWYLGDADVDWNTPRLSGQIGWVREETHHRTTFDPQSARWVDDLTPSAAGNHAPFVYDGQTQRLAVLQHPSFRPETLTYVFTKLLNRGEERRDARVAHWEVEPLLDGPSFRTWLERAEVVRSATFVAKLPNPDGMEGFEEVLARMEERKAAVLREQWEARDPDEGLQDIEEDRDAQQMIAMAELGYGYVTAEGVGRNGRKVRFDQRKTVAREITPPLPSSWPEMMAMFIDFALTRLRRRDN